MYAVSVGAQQGNSSSDWQLWPEVDVSIKLNQRVSVVASGTLHFGKDVSDLNEEQAGVGFNVALNKYLSLSPFYRYGKGQPPGRSHTHEHRVSVDFSGRFPLGEKFFLSDRSRGELRCINGIESHRYRNRVQVERSLTIADHRITPYVSDEVFYDDRYHAWSRNRIYAGARVPLGQHFSLDGYYLEQYDGRDRPFARRHVVGLNFRIDY